MPGDEPSPARHPLRRAVTDDLRLKALALAIAVLLWLVVGARTQTEGYVTVRVEPALDSSLALLGGPPRVRALVAGRSAELVKLYAAPPVVRRAVAGDAPDTLLLEITPADVHIPADLAAEVRVLDVQPRSVMLRFETRATRSVSVVNDGRVRVRGAGHRAVRLEPETVRISGPRDAVRRLRTLHPVALELEPGDTLTHLAELDTAGLGVRVHPAQVRVRAAPEGAQ